MKLKEVILELGTADQIRTSMYRNLGIGGAEGNELAAKDNFLKRFKQQVKLNQQSAGKYFDLPELVTSYLSQYGWVANAQDQERLQDMAKGGNIDELANYMYYLGSKQIRNPKTGAVLGGGSSIPSGQAGAAGGQQMPLADQPVLSPPTQQTIKQIAKLTGKENYDDLEQIAKNSMRQLYKQNPARYTELYKEIMTGKSNPNKLGAYNPQDPADVRKAKQAAVSNQVFQQGRGEEFTGPAGNVMGQVAKNLQPNDASPGAGAFGSMAQTLGGPGTPTTVPQNNPSDTRSQKFDKAAMAARAGMKDVPQDFSSAEKQQIGQARARGAMSDVAPTDNKIDFAKKRADAAAAAQASMKPKVAEQYNRPFYRRK